MRPVRIFVAALAGTAAGDALRQFLLDRRVAAPDATPGQPREAEIVITAVMSNALLAALASWILFRRGRTVVAFGLGAMITAAVGRLIDQAGWAALRSH